jgi:hypothetical protein
MQMSLLEFYSSREAVGKGLRIAGWDCRGRGVGRDCQFTAQTGARGFDLPPVVVPLLEVGRSC